MHNIETDGPVGQFEGGPSVASDRHARLGIPMSFGGRADALIENAGIDSAR